MSHGLGVGSVGGNRNLQGRFQAVSRVSSAHFSVLMAFAGFSKGEWGPCRAFTVREVVSLELLLEELGRGQGRVWVRVRAAPFGGV